MWKNGRMREALIKLLERLTNAKTIDSVLKEFMENTELDISELDENCHCIFCGRPFQSFKERMLHVTEQDCVIDFRVLPKRKVEIYLNDEYDPD